MIAWGNGEPCPFCGKKIPPSFKHLYKKHPDKIKEMLFPDKETTAEEMEKIDIME